MMKSCIGAGLALALLAPVFAVASPRTPGVEAVLACRAMTDKAAQLDCFMAASQKLAGETDAAAPTPKPRAFGMPRAPAPKPAKAAEEPRTVALRLTGLFDPGDERIVFNFSDGSNWREIEPDMIGGSLRLGQTVTIEKAFLGSYMLDIPGRASVRVKRDRDDR